jgi:extracellular elastinolytic metalloproteinase
VLAVAVLTLLALSVPSSGLGVARIDEIHDELADFDSREAVTAPAGYQLSSVARMGATAQWNRFGTPQSLFKHRGWLARGLRGRDSAAVARSWLRSNQRLFRLESVQRLRLDRSLPIGAGRVVIFRQTVGGLPVSPDGLVTVGLVPRGKGWNIAYASSSLTPHSTLAGLFRLSAAEAVVRAVRNLGKRVSLGDLGAIYGRTGWSYLRADGLDEQLSVRRIAFATARGTVPAWHTVVSGFRDGVGESYGHVIDARSGRVLLRQNHVDHAADNPKWEVFPASPQMTQINEFPWNYPSADVRDLWCWFDGSACQLAVIEGSPHKATPWDVEARTNTPTFTTIGNNADSQEEWHSAPGHVGPGPNQFRPVSPTRDYVYPWTNVWFETRCDRANFSAPGGNDASAATANLFAMHNRMHDWSYHLGFTERAWNAQDFNFGSPTLENDELDGNVQAGGASGGAPTWSGRDNAFMSTRPDGTSSVTSMFLWQPIAGTFYAPCVDGDYDMSVIGHEYNHMIENRMIGKGVRRQGHHAGAMGESSSDFTAAEYLNEYGFQTPGADPFAVGPYVTGDGDQAIRNYNMSWPSAGHFPEPGLDPFINPLNFSDVGYDLTGPQVHADGEIWTATNFDIRELLLQRYPQQGLNHQRECADGQRPAQDCPGNRRWIQLVFDAYLLAPVAPTFLDMRDAILAADVIRFGGANQDLLWLAFARRGFGQNAANAGTQDVQPTPDFESPLEDEATVTFNAVAQETGVPVNANIYVGHYEARVSPVADTNPATAGPNLDNVARFVPDDGPHVRSGQRAYEFVANAPGYGHVRFRLTELKPGETRSVTIHFPTNYASRHQGAVAAGDGIRHDDLIDDTEGTNWESTGAPVQGRRVVVDLSGGAQRFEVVKVSAALVAGDFLGTPQQPNPTQNRFTALRAFEVYACTAGSDRRNLGCADTSEFGWKRIVKSQDDAFPSVNPRPRQPELILRTWETPTTTATHVMFVVVDNQCTGQDSYQGEQDNDPTNATDCRTGSPPLPPRNLDVRAAELQVLSDNPRVDGATSEE